MKTNNFILIVFVFFFTFLKAQTDYRPGFIIKKAGDTIYGNIDYRGDILMSKICKFKSDNDNITEFLPEQIKAYRFTDSKYFISRKIEEKNVFLEYLIKGEINVYFLKDIKGERYFIDKQDEPLIEIPYSEGIKYVRDKPRFYKSTRHYGVLSYYLKDAPSTFKPKIDRIKKPNRYNLISLAEDYHNAVCDDEKCIVYEKKVPLVKISVEPIIGQVKYKDSENSSIEYGGYIYLWAPRSNEKLYFKTGLTYQKIQLEGIKEGYKIPFQIQYIYPSKVFKPKLSVGLNFFKFVSEDGVINFYDSFAINTGFNYKISNSTFLSANINSDFTSFNEVFFDDDALKLISYSFSLGLYIEL